jgi:1,4-dihydroxy-2-naphthoate octaprenyltransferase
MQAAPMPEAASPLRAWLLVLRVPTLSAAVVPVLVGTATAAHLAPLRVGPFGAALTAALLIQTIANLANDYFDLRHGADAAGRLGPVRVRPGGQITPEAARTAALVAFALLVLLGGYLVVVGGWPILVAGVAAIAAAVLYTGGPWPYGYHGLGDLFVFVYFGLVGVGGSAYLQSPVAVGPSLVNALPVGFLITAILVVNNLRDRETDRAAGKRTLAVLLGDRATRLEYLLLVGGAYLVPLLRWLAGAATPWFWLPWLTLPLAFRLVQTIRREDGRALNPALKGTAQLNLLFGILFAVSLVA